MMESLQLLGVLSIFIKQLVNNLGHPALISGKSKDGEEEEEEQVDRYGYFNDKIS